MKTAAFYRNFQVNKNLLNAEDTAFTKTAAFKKLVSEGNFSTQEKLFSADYAGRYDPTDWATMSASDKMGFRKGWNWEKYQEQVKKES